MTEYDVVVLVPLNEEFQTVSTVFDVKNVFTRRKITFYEFEPISDGDNELDIVGVVLNRMGNPTAAQKTERVLSIFDPHLVAVVGIAGCLDDDLRLGDVIVAEEVTNYEVKSKIVDSKKRDDETGSGNSNDTEGRVHAQANRGELGDSPGQSAEDKSRTDSIGDDGLPIIDWQPGGVTRHCAEEVIEAVTTFRNQQSSQYDSWQDTTESKLADWVDPDSEEIREEDYRPPSRVQRGAIASGGLVVASAKFSKRLSQQNRNFVAVEMEAAGVMSSVQRTDGVNAMIVRGLSDFADKKKTELEDMDGAYWRKCATYAAASYLRTFLSSGMLEMAQPRVSTTEPTGPVSWSPVSVTELSRETLEIADRGGPAKTYLREYPVPSSTFDLGTASTGNGISAVVEFDIESTVPLSIALAGVELPERDVERVIEQRIYINGTQMQTRSKARGHLTEQYLLGADTTASVRIESYFEQANTPGRPRANSRKERIELSVQLQGTENQLPTYTVNGFISEQRGLIIDAISIEDRNTNGTH